MEHAIGAALAFVLIVPTLLIARNKKWEALVYPGFMITLPLFYMGFAALTDDPDLIVKEAIYGIPYFVAGVFLLLVPFRYSAYFVGIGWLSHGLYDIYHDVFFVNPGVWDIYPAFCGVIDLVFGSYLIYRATQLRGGDLRNAESQPV